MTAGGFLGELWITMGVDTSGLAIANVSVKNMQRVTEGAYAKITTAANASSASQTAAAERNAIAQMALDDRLMLKRIKAVNAREAAERKAAAVVIAQAEKVAATQAVLAAKEIVRAEKVAAARIAAAERAAALEAGAFAKSVALMNSGINRLSLAFTRFGQSMSMYLTAPVLLIGAAVVKTVSEFDFLQKKIVAFTSTTQDQMNAWIPEIKRISDETHISSKEIAESFYFVANSAVPAATTLKIVEYSAKAAAAGMGSAADIGKALTFVFNAYGESAFDAAKTMDMLAIAIREGIIEIDQIVPVIGPVLPAAAALGVSFDQVASAIAVMTRTGFNAARSATGFGQMLFALQKPSKGAEEALNAVGGEMKVLGSAFLEMRTIIREQGLIAGLVKIKELVATYGETLVGKVFGNIRAFREVLGLIGPQFVENEKVFKKAATESGAFARAWAISTQSVKFSLQGVKVAFQNILLSIGGQGGGLIVFFDDLSRKLNAVAGWFKNLTPAVQQHYIHMALYAAMIGPVIILLGNLIRVIGGLVSAVLWLFTPWTTLIKIWGWAAIAIKSVSNVYLSMMAVMGINPWIGAAIAIVAVTAALVAYFSMQEKVSKAQKAVNDVNATAASSIVNEKVQIEQLMRILKSENTTKEQKLIAIKKLNAISPEYLSSITQESINTGEATDAINKYIKALGDKARAKAIEAKMVETEQTYVTDVMSGADKKLSFLQKMEYSMYWKNILKARVDYDNAEKLGNENAKEALRLKDETMGKLQKMADALSGVAKAQKEVNEATAAAKIPYTSLNIPEGMFGSKYTKPYEISHNNPGNIERGKNKWAGEILDSTGRFATFQDMGYGFAAQFKLLRTYIEKYNKDTLTKIIERWAPSNENDTAKYIKDVAGWSGLNPTEKIDPNNQEQMLKLVLGMFRKEEGMLANKTDILAGWDIYTTGKTQREASNFRPGFFKEAVSGKSNTPLMMQGVPSYVSSSSGGSTATEAQKLALLNTAIGDYEDEQKRLKALEDALDKYTESLQSIGVKVGLFTNETRKFGEELKLSFDFVGADLSAKQTYFDILTEKGEGATDAVKKLAKEITELKKRTEYQDTKTTLMSAKGSAGTYVNDKTNGFNMVDLGYSVQELDGQFLQLGKVAIGTIRQIKDELKTSNGGFSVMIREAADYAEYLQEIKDLVKEYYASLDENQTKAISNLRGGNSGKMNPWKLQMDDLKSYLNFQKQAEKLAIKHEDLEGFLDAANNVDILTKRIERVTKFEKFNVIFGQIGQGINNILGEYVNMIDAKKQTAYDSIDSIAKYEGRSAEWIAKKREQIDAEYGRKKKAAAIAEATINMFIGISSALKTPWMIPFIAALGIMQIANIRKTKMAEGGIVPGGYNNDTYPALLSSGETVIPASPNKLSFGSRKQTIHLTGRLVAEGRDLVYAIDKEVTLMQSY